MVATMNPTQCLTLPVFYAFTGCDTVSAFAGRGKKTAWETWKSFQEVNDASSELLCRIHVTARAICSVDVRTSESMEVDARKHGLHTEV